MERMATLEPLFVDVTWGAGGSTSDLTLAISANAQQYSGVEVLMHLTCTNLKVVFCCCCFCCCVMYALIWYQYIEDPRRSAAPVVAKSVM